MSAHARALALLVAAASSSVACATRSTRAFSHLSTPRLGAPSAARVDGSSQLSRRAALGGALALGLVPTRSLAAFPKLFGPTVEVLAQPKACQSRTLRDDFVRVRYEGRRQDGTPVDVRYRDRDLVFQLGDAFYLPGFSQALTGVCTGATYRLSWGGAPALSEAEQAVLPPGTPIVYDVQLLRVEYDGFREKMRDVNDETVFAPGRMTLTSEPDARFYANSNEPVAPGPTLLEFFDLAL